MDALLDVGLEPYGQRWLWVCPRSGPTWSVSSPRSKRSDVFPFPFTIAQSNHEIFQKFVWSSEDYIWKCVISDLYLFWKLVIWKSLVSKICYTENWLFWKYEYLKIVCFEVSFSKINVLKNNDPKIDYTEKSVHPHSLICSSSSVLLLLKSSRRLRVRVLTKFILTPARWGHSYCALSTKYIAVECTLFFRRREVFLFTTSVQLDNAWRLLPVKKVRYM